MRHFLDYDFTVGDLRYIRDEYDLGACMLCFSMGGRGNKPVTAVEGDEFGRGAAFLFEDADPYDVSWAMNVDDVLARCDELGFTDDVLVIGNYTDSDYPVTAGAWDDMDDLLVMKATRSFQE